MLMRRIYFKKFVTTKNISFSRYPDIYWLRGSYNFLYRNRAKKDSPDKRSTDIFVVYGNDANKIENTDMLCLLFACFFPFL